MRGVFIIVVGEIPRYSSYCYGYYFYYLVTCVSLDMTFAVERVLHMKHQSWRDHTFVQPTCVSLDMTFVVERVLHMRVINRDAITRSFNRLVWHRVVCGEALAGNAIQKSWVWEEGDYT